MNKSIIFMSNRFSSVIEELYNHPEITVKYIVEATLDSDNISKLNSYAINNGIPYLKITQESPELLALVNEIKPDFIIIYALHFLISNELLSSPRLATLNLHPSLLPAYRGPNPWMWQYINQEEIGGFTVHKVSPKEDDGDILLQDKFTIDYKITNQDFNSKMLKDVGIPLLCKAIINYESIPTIPQNAKSPTIRARNIFDLKNDESIKNMKKEQQEIMKIIYPKIF